MKQKNDDPLLERFLDQWDNETDLYARARILRRFTQYLKKRYGDTKAHSVQIADMVGRLETELCKVYDFTAGVIGDVRRTIKSSGKDYGSGLRRKPTSEELTDIKSFKSVPKVISVEHMEDIDPDDESFTDLRDELENNQKTVTG